MPFFKYTRGINELPPVLSGLLNWLADLIPRVPSVFSQGCAEHKREVAEADSELARGQLTGLNE
jgi:hypothetical protein